MMATTLIKRLSFCTALVVAMSTHAGTQAKFFITPVGSNTLSVSVGGSAPVSYNVTNNLPEAFPLVLDMASLGSVGVTQLVSGSNPCAAPIFRLGAGESCTLTLLVSASAIGGVGSSKSFSGPQICIYSGGQGNFACSQPSLGQGLNVRVTV